MKRLVLNYIALINFKGNTIKVELSNNTIISGENETGKTSIADAWYWLLKNKDSYDRTKFGIKKLVDGKLAQGLECIVEASINFDSKEIVLKKVYREVWSKKTGQAVKTLTGDTNDYFIDGDKCKEKEFVEFVNAIVDDQTFKILTNPLYFSEKLPDKDRRELILKTIDSNIPTQDIINKNSELKDVANVLSDKDENKVLSSLRDKKTDLNKEIEKIPIRISEVDHNLDLPNDINFESLEKEKEKLEKDNQKMLEEKDTILKNYNDDKQDSIDAVTVLQTQLSNLQLEKINSGSKNKEVQIKIDELNSKISASKRLIEDCKFQVKTYSDKKINSESDKKDIIEKANEIQNRKFEGCICSECGREYPAEKLNEAETNFENAKEKDKSEIKTKFLQIKESIEKYTKWIKESEEKISDLEKQIVELNNEILTNKKKITINDTSEIDKKISELEKQIEDAKFELQKKGSPVKLRELDVKIKVNNDRIMQIEKTLSKKETYKKALKRIEELKLEEKKLSASYLELERKINLIQTYIREKSYMLSDRLNSVFRNVRFKLFDELKNGGIKDTFEVMVEGKNGPVPFNQGASTGQKIAAGIEIVNQLSKYYDLSLPIMADNAEGVTKEIVSESQLIKFKSTEGVKKLKVEG